MSHVSLPHRIIPLFVIVLLAFLIVSITRLGVADIYAQASYRTLKAWQLSPFEMSDKKWDDIQNDLERAREFDPANPELLMALGQAHEGRFADAGIQLPEGRTDREQALEYYRQSVQLRPGWPYGWIDLALVKYRLGELDREFHDAVLLSLELGPSEPGVQKVLIEIGLHGWNDVNDEMHTLVFDTIKKALAHTDKQHVNTIISLLEEYNILYYACLAAKEDPYLIKRTCKGS